MVHFDGAISANRACTSHRDVEQTPYPVALLEIEIALELMSFQMKPS